MIQSRKSWIAFGKKTKGFVLIDAAAAVAVRNKNKSLLASGIVSSGGNFNRGDTVSIMVPDPIEKQNIEIARGLTNYNRQDLLKIIGKSSAEIKKEFPYMLCEEVIHKDNLVVIK